MEELYKIMKEIREEYYNTGKIDIDAGLFFRLFKVVCDLWTIQRIVEGQ